MSFLLLLFPITQLGLIFAKRFLKQELVAENLTWPLLAATSGYWVRYKRVDLPATRLLLKPPVVEKLSVTIIIASLLLRYADMITKYASHHNRNIISNITAVSDMSLPSALQMQQTNQPKIFSSWHYFVHFWRLLALFHLLLKGVKYYQNNKNQNGNPCNISNF